MAPSKEVMGWLNGLAAMGCTFSELLPGLKRTRKSWDHYRGQASDEAPSSAVSWLRKGSGVGIFPRFPLWVLDIDSPAWVDRVVSDLLDAQMVPLMVRTPSGGAHLYFRFPDGFPLAGLKHHLCHPEDADGCTMPVDFKLGDRTLVVAPGTVREGREYKPTSPWRTPPTADPRNFLPSGQFWKPVEPKRPFLTCERPRKDRLARARVYLRSKAPLSISGKHGYRTLAGVAAHLCAYLKLAPETAVNLLTHGDPSWNARCTDKVGKPCPWDRDDLLSACEDALDAVPSAGVKAWDRLQASQRERAKLGTMVGALKDSLTDPEWVRVPVAEVLESFQWTGLPDLTPTALGDELVRQEVKRVRATRKRILCIPRLNLWAMQGRILEVDRLRQVQEGRTEGCALIKHLGSLRVEHQVSGAA